MQELIEQAVELHQSGQLGQAQQIYQKILAKDQENASALHLLGVLHHQQGDHAKAVELIGKAVAIRPSVPAFHANLAEAYRAQGKFDRAVGCCRSALRLWPEYPEALCNLGVSLQGMGKHEEAIGHLRKAIELKPDFTMAINNLAIGLRELGKGDEAFALFQRAVELDPNFPPARTNLGQMLLDRGQPDAALPHCLEGVRLQPDLAAMHHNLGNVYRVLDRLVDARSEYLEALRLSPELAQAAAHLGLVLKGEDKLGEALPWLKQAVDQEPSNATYWEYLADLHSDREDPAEAILCWEKVLILSPKETAAMHLSLGWALQEEGRLEEAESHYKKALELEPASASARLNMGGLHEELGRMQSAEAAFREALALQPGFPLPHARLATLLRGKLSEEDFEALEKKLSEPTIPQEPKSHLLFASAHVLDAKGQYAHAGDRLLQANTLRRELDKDKRHYDPAEHEKFVDNLVRVFDSDLLNRLHGQGAQSRRPVFVFGLPRSGTTLIEQILSSHPKIFGAGELRYARQSFELISATLEREDPPIEAAAKLTPEALKTIADKHLQKLETLDKGAPARIVDKMPDNYMYIGFLSLLFPGATFIHCRRDLRDVAVSCWMTDFRSIRWANDAGHIGARFEQYRRLMNHWAGTLKAPIVHVDYEETVENLEGVARRIVEACGVEWNPACLEFHSNARPVRTASITQVRQPIYKRSVARWKNYDQHLGGLFSTLYPE